MIDERRHYLSYLLRLWRERATLPAVWRASLENPQTGERLGFADIMQLFAFLEKQVADETTHEMPDPPESREEEFSGDKGRSDSGDVAGML